MTSVKLKPAMLPLFQFVFCSFPSVHQPVPIHFKYVLYLVRPVKQVAV